MNEQTEVELDDDINKSLKGEFRGDFTRDTFDPAKHYTRVLMQQGRVQLDADWNEQADILMHYLRALAIDLIGPYGGPCSKAGFKITEWNNNGNKDLEIGKGHYYVDGIQCVNKEPVPVTYLNQVDFPLLAEEKKLPNPPFLVYLDVWERNITCNEDPDIREIALGFNGPDTTIRSQIVWQVKVCPPIDDTKQTKYSQNGLNEIVTAMQNVVDSHGIPNFLGAYWDFTKVMLRPFSTGQLIAEASKPVDDTDLCIIKPEARYRGKENQLYRVEIHEPGFAENATFKWSRENGSVTIPIISLNKNSATLAHLGRDDRINLSHGDWVEIIDDGHVLREEPGNLLLINSVDRSSMAVTFNDSISFVSSKYSENPENHLQLRRWDYKLPDDNKTTRAMKIQEGEPLCLENGVQIQFVEGGYYNTGDYWLIPARTATGDVIWPYTDETKEHRKPLPPHGIKHHYAPLAIVKAKEESSTEREGNEIYDIISCLHTFKLATCDDESTTNK